MGRLSLHLNSQERPKCPYAPGCGKHWKRKRQATAMLSQRANSYQGKGEPGLSSRLSPAQGCWQPYYPRSQGPPCSHQPKNVFRPFKLKRSHGKQKGHIWSEWHVLLCQSLFTSLLRVFSTLKMGSVLGLINCLIYFPGISFLDL